MPHDSLCSPAPQPKPKPKRPRKPRTPKPDVSHEWLGAAIIPLTSRQGRRVLKYQSFWTDQKQKIEVLDVYCGRCRLNMEDVDKQPCAAKIDNRHLIGGDQSVRAKRKRAVMPPGAVLIPGPTINRRGIDAVINREA